MKYIYVLAIIYVGIKTLILPNTVGGFTVRSIAEQIALETGIPNAVSGIILMNRLYDTVFEVVVFTIAIMACYYLLSGDQLPHSVKQFTDQPSIVLAQLGATISALVSFELAIRGHLSPGGGFAAGVAGGTAIGLVAITSSLERMEDIYHRWHAQTWEKVSVIVFVLLATVTLWGFELPSGTFGSLISGGMIPILNLLVGIKVALGSWAVVLLFIRYRGLL